MPEPSSFESVPIQASHADPPSDSALRALPTFTSASGRVIRGGGGICPDVFLPRTPIPTPLRASLLARRVFQDFATYYQGLHRRTDDYSSSLGSNFTLTEGEWAHLRQMATASYTTVPDSTWLTERPFLLRQVRIELADRVVGATMRYQIALEDDAQLEAAVALLPRAKSLLHGEH